MHGPHKEYPPRANTAKVAKIENVWKWDQQKIRLIGGNWQLTVVGITFTFSWHPEMFHILSIFKYT